MFEGKQTRLLVVDEEESHLEALCLTLEEHGYQVRGFADCDDALLALKDAPWDLMLADMTMPGMNGIELMEAALAIDPTLVVIIMTGTGTIGSAVLAMQSGALDYIVKPLRLNALLPLLSRAITVRRLRVDNAALQCRVVQHAAELERLNNELEAFTRSAAHDLRSPLNIVQGLSSLLLDKVGPSLPEGQRNWLVQIDLAARRMSELIEALMRLSCAGRRELILGDVDVATLVRDVLFELEGEHPQRRVTLTISELPHAVADLPLLRQVYVNLLSNAFKFTRNTNQAEILVGCECQDNELVFFVKDNGPGFDMKRADRLFDAFQRLHRADEFEGSGLGLSIAQRIIHRHGGRIWARATLTQGAGFFFTLHGTTAPATPFVVPRPVSPQKLSGRMTATHH